MNKKDWFSINHNLMSYCFFNSQKPGPVKKIYLETKRKQKIGKTWTKHWQNYASLLFKITCTGDVDLLRIVSNGLEIIHWSWYYTRYIAVSGVSMTTLLEHSLAKLTDYRFSPKCLKFKLWIRYHKVVSSSITLVSSMSWLKSVHFKNTVTPEA